MYAKDLQRNWICILFKFLHYTTGVLYAEIQFVENQEIFKNSFYPRYCNDPRFSDSQIWATSADPDQTAPKGAVWSGSTLFAIPSASFGCIVLRKIHLVQLLGWLQQIFGCLKF